jgi:CheY-like chemotaxis protein
LKLKKHFDNSSIKSYFKSDVAFNFIHDNFSELENTVLLDLNMPVMDGFQVLENLISISHILKVIIVTSLISDEDGKGVVLLSCSWLY